MFACSLLLASGFWEKDCISSLLHLGIALPGPAQSFHGTVLVKQPQAGRQSGPGFLEGEFLRGSLVGGYVCGVIVLEPGPLGQPTAWSQWNDQ